MSNESNVTARGGIGFCGLLAIVFIVLKLIGLISWSWLWVLAPIWIPVVLSIVYLIASFIILLIVSNKKK